MNNKRLRIMAMILSIMGILDSLYLLNIKLTQNKALCIPGIGDCWSVNLSSFSEIWGIPISLIGAIAYLVLFTLLWQENKLPILTNYSPLLLFGMTLTGFLYSIYLTYIEIAVLQAICPFCVISAIVMTCLFIISIIRLRRTI
jgi:uncharacterized membrane protein